ncbi:chemokine-binding protein [Enterobacillus tribolii]|uniref:DUF4148 domain-containing protein n=1 Tax=Enterobacillus tribolii TaxID=1487935 RepID=A0A370QGQ0_9GAMM|nr:chemokine-binding protein [Enterobacillus tribolii]MBW7981849.1 chemokine-binding protein [Enterobacillus tribolii]RDK87531.1 hypothetical protein C8D90_109126 [Enterobacillus tribolii]
MKTIAMTALIALTLTGSAFAQTFSQLSPAEQSALAYSNHNGTAYEHQLMAKQKLQQGGIAAAKVNGSATFSQLSAQDQRAAVINALNNGDAYAHQSEIK